MDHNSIMIHCCFYFTKWEILRKDDRSRKMSIITLLYEHPLGIKINRSMLSFSRECENIAWKRYINLTRIDSCNWCNDDNLLCKIEDINCNLSYIDLMVSIIMNIYWYWLMFIMWSFRSMRRYRCTFYTTDTKNFRHK